MIPPTPIQLESSPFQFYEHDLPGNLHITLGIHPNATSTVIHLIYQVGSCDEYSGISGLAHLFEHLMYQGTLHTKKGEFLNTIMTHGGKVNAFTGEETTIYYQIIPPNLIDLGLWMEAERMGGVLLTDETIDNQKSVVIEEKKQREDQPYGKVWNRISELFYTHFAYAHPVIGSVEDITKVTKEQVHTFYKTYYHPSNAYLSICGTFDYERTLTSIQNYFIGIEQGTRPQRTLFDPIEKGESIEEVYYDNIVPLPGLFLAFPAPNYGSLDQAAFIIFDVLFGFGNSSVVYHRLIKKDEVAFQVDTSYMIKQGPSMYLISVFSKGTKPNESIKSAIEEELNLLALGNIPEDWIEKAKVQIRSQIIFSLRQNYNITSRVNMNRAHYGDILYTDKLLKMINQVTKQDIVQVVKRWILETRHIYLHVYPTQS